MPIDMDALQERLTEESPIVVILTTDQFDTIHADVYSPPTEGERNSLTINSDQFEEDIDGICEVLDMCGYSQATELPLSDYLIDVDPCGCSE